MKLNEVNFVEGVYRPVPGHISLPETWLDLFLGRTRDVAVTYNEYYDLSVDTSPVWVSLSDICYMSQEKRSSFQRGTGKNKLADGFVDLYVTITKLVMSNGHCIFVTEDIDELRDLLEAKNE